MPGKEPFPELAIPSGCEPYQGWSACVQSGRRHGDMAFKPCLECCERFWDNAEKQGRYQPPVTPLNSIQPILGSSSFLCPSLPIILKVETPGLCGARVCFCQPPLPLSFPRPVSIWPSCSGWQLTLVANQNRLLTTSGNGNLSKSGGNGPALPKWAVSTHNHLPRKQT